MKTSFKIPHRMSASVSQWIEENDLLEIISFEWTTNTLTFDNEEDATAFTLRFKFEPDIVVGYRGQTSIDISYYYCPYIPLQI